MRAQCVLATRRRGTRRVPRAPSWSARVGGSGRRSLSKKDRDEVLYAKNGRPADHDEERWEDEEGEGKEHLDRQLSGRLLGALASLRPQQIRVRTQRLCHAGTETVALDDQAGKRLQ